MNRLALLSLFFGQIALLNAQPAAATTTRPSVASPPGAPANESRSALVQEARWRVECAAASPEALRNRIIAILSRRGSPATSSEYLVALEYLAQKTGQEAWAFVLAHPFEAIEPRPLKEAFVRGWAFGDIDAAEKWLSSTDSGWSDEDLSEMGRVLLRIDAASDGPRAMQRAFRLGATRADPHSQQENNAMVVMETLVYTGHFDDAYNVSETVKPDDVRNAVQANLVGVTADHRPDLAVKWYRALPLNEEKRSVLMRLVESLSSHGFKAAADFYQSLDKNDHSPDLLATLILNGQGITYASATQLINETPDSPDYDQVFAAALTKLNAVTPGELPWAWLGKIHDPRLRNGTLWSLILPLYHQDAKKAQAVVDQLTFLSSSQKSALRDHLSAATSTDAKNSYQGPLGR